MLLTRKLAINHRAGDQLILAAFQFPHGLVVSADIFRILRQFEQPFVIFEGHNSVKSAVSTPIISLNFTDRHNLLVLVYPQPIRTFGYGQDQQ